MMTAWLPQVVGTLQAAAGATLIGELEEIQRELERTVRALPAPRTPDERITLRGLLVEFAWRSARQIHARAHGKRTAPCSFRGEASVFEFFAHHARDPRDAFLAWLPAFFTEFAHTHPRSKAGRIAHALRVGYRDPVHHVALARRVQMREPQLRRAFRSEFGMSIREYRERVRVLASLQDLDRERWKLEAIARHVGYRTKKNFYRAFKQAIGLTPAGFRRCPPDERRHIIDSMRTAFHVLGEIRRPLHMSVDDGNRAESAGLARRVHEGSR